MDIDLGYDEVRFEQFMLLLKEYDDYIYALTSNSELTGEGENKARLKVWELYLKTKLL